MTKKEKLEKLVEISTKLKTEFVGISGTIDTLIDSVTPWYVTPELLERPVVISLWGLTGTGKTSVVRKLIDYLDLQDRSLFFDCGAEENTDSSISDKITGFYDSGSGTQHILNPGSFSDRQELHGVFIFDEFQYSRTIDEDGNEVSKSTQRSIWNLLDSGILDIIQRPYEVKELMTFSEELEFLVQELGSDLKITSGCWPESALQRVSETIDFYKTWEDEEDDKENKEHQGKPILRRGKRETLVSRLNSLEHGLGYQVNKDLNSAGTIGEFSEILGKYTRILSQPKKLDCSKSLVFVIGNLDEAFGHHGDLDPDMDADVFAKITKKTCVSDIKEALKKRFRVEQIGRLGSNLIIYPSLSKSDFSEIIERELQRIFEKFKSDTGIEVEATQGFKDLLYLEGVTPSQGVRPLLSTIGTMCLPKLSKILSSECTKAVLDIKGDPRSSQVITIISTNNGIFEVKENLKIGFLRSRGSCEKIAAHAIHEAGHAVMMTWAKQEIPEMILAQSSLGGGYTYGELDKEDRESARSKAEVRQECMVGLAGICAEHIFFDDQHCTIGCSQDYQEVWECIAEAAYHGGFFGTAYPWSNPDYNKDFPSGASDKEILETGIEEKIRYFLEHLYEEVSTILEKDRELIRQIALYLVDQRCMMPDTYKEYLERYGTSELLKKYSGSNDSGYWLERIKNKEA